MMRTIRMICDGLWMPRIPALSAFARSFRMASREAIGSGSFFRRSRGWVTALRRGGSRFLRERRLRHTWDTLSWGPRLRECTLLVNLVEGRSIGEIFGYPDDLKFRSCMTLFAQVSPDNQIFIDALEKYCGGKFDPLTLERL